MKQYRIKRIMDEMKRDDARASHLAVGALLIITILYAATIG